MADAKGTPDEHPRSDRRLFCVSVFQPEDAGRAWLSVRRLTWADAGQTAERRLWRSGRAFLVMMRALGPAVFGIISDWWERRASHALLETPAKDVISQMLPEFSFGEKLPASIRMMRRSRSAQQCHRAQAACGLHPLLYSLFCVGVVIIMPNNQLNCNALRTVRFGGRQLTLRFQIASRTRNCRAQLKRCHNKTRRTDIRVGISPTRVERMIGSGMSPAVAWLGRAKPLGSPR